MTEELGEIGLATPPILSALFEQLKYQMNSIHDQDAVMHAVPSHALGKMGRPAIPGLVEALKDEGPGVAMFSIFALGEIGREAPEEVVPILIKALEHQDPQVRSNAAYVFWNNNLPAKKGLPALIKSASDEDRFVRWQAIKALSAGGFKAEDVRPVFIKALQDTDEFVQELAADCLGEMGIEAKEAEPILRQKLYACPEDRNGCIDAGDDACYKNVCVSFLGALGSIGASTESETIEVFRDLLPSFGDKRRTLQRQWATTVSKMGPSVVPTLTQDLASQNPIVRETVRKTLGMMAINP